MLPEERTLQDVLVWTPNTLLAWIQRHAAQIECDEDWPSLAYWCNSQIVINPSLARDEILALAAAAIIIWTRLSEVCLEESDRYRYIESSMSVRATVINKFGPQIGDSIRDPSLLEKWFFQELDLTYNEALAMCEESLSLSTNDFLRISCLRDRLRLMKSIQSQEAFKRTSDLTQWYDLIDIQPR